MQACLEKVAGKLRQLGSLWCSTPGSAKLLRKLLNNLALRPGAISQLAGLCSVVHCMLPMRIQLRCVYV